MRKSNWLVATLAVVASAALLWAWFALGFNHVDDPLDLIVAILWCPLLPSSTHPSLSGLLTDVTAHIYFHTHLYIHRGIKS